MPQPPFYSYWACEGSWEELAMLVDLVDPLTMAVCSLPEGMEGAERARANARPCSQREWLGSRHRAIHCVLHSLRELGPATPAAMNVTATARAAAAPTTRPCTARVRQWLLEDKYNDQAYLQAAAANPPLLSPIPAFPPCSRHRVRPTAEAARASPRRGNPGAAPPAAPSRWRQRRRRRRPADGA